MLRIVTNRRTSHCCMCGRTIKPGDKCIAYPPVKHGDTWETDKECAVCAEIEGTEQ